MTAEEVNQATRERIKLLESYDQIKLERDGALAQIRELENRLQTSQQSNVEMIKELEARQSMVQRLSDMVDIKQEEVTRLTHENELLREERLTWGIVIGWVVQQFAQLFKQKRVK